MSEKIKIHVYYDGNCPMCNAFAELVKKNDTEATLLDAQTNTKNTHRREDLLREIHVFESDGKVRTGADAILTTLGRIYPIFTYIARLFRIPIFSHIANVVYYFVAKRRTMWFGGSNARVFWLLLVTTLGLLAGLTVSWPLWENTRLYPEVPIFPVGNLPAYTNFLSGTLVLILIGTFFAINKLRWFVLGCITLIALLICLDITRLQPWIFHYFSLLALLLFWQPTKNNSTDDVLTAARIIIVSIYFWSGLQKMNTAFWLEVWPWFTETLWTPHGEIGAYTMLSVGVFVPFIEVFFALGLLTKKFRKISLIASACMLAVVTGSIIIGREWNISVWPWNFAIFLMVMILFYKNEETLIDMWQKAKKSTLALCAFLFFVIMPAGNVTGLTPHYLSWSLYSGHVPVGYLTASAETIEALGTSKDSRITHSNNLQTVNFVDWSTHTIRVVPYPEEWVFEKVFAQICNRFPGDANMALTIETRQFFLSHNKQQRSEVCKNTI